MKRFAATLLACLALVAPASAQPDRFSLEARDTDLADVIRLLSAQSGQNVVADGSVRAQRVTIRLKDVSFEQALATLVSAYGLQTHRDGRITIVGDAASMNRRFPDDATPGGTQTQVFTLRHAQPGELVASLQNALAQGTVVVGDKRTGNLVVTGSPQTIARARQLVAALDAPGRQVMFEVRVADVEPVNDSSNVGIEFGGTGFGTGALGQFPYTLTKSSVTVNAQLSALVQRGHASILAQPRIATLNNREASLLVGQQYPVVTVNQQTGFPTVQTVDVGVRLRLTPTIGSDGSVTADLHPEYSAIIGFNNGVPVIANRKIDATLSVRDGDTIVLGGLFQDVDSDTVTKLPLLGDLPVLGGFFRNRQRTHNRDEVIFFITPHILTAEGHELPTSKAP